MPDMVVRMTLDRVLLRKISPQEKTSAAGLILPTGVEEETLFEATVLAFGPGRMVPGVGFEKVELKAMDRVLVHRGGLSQTRMGGETLYIGRYDNVQCVFEPKALQKAQGISDYLGIDMPRPVAPPMMLEEAKIADGSAEGAQGWQEEVPGD